MMLLSSSQKLLLSQAAYRYQEDLAADTSAQTYLASRGLGQEAAAMFRLGVVRRPLAGHEHLAGRLAIPYLAIPTPTGRGGGVLGMRFRCLRDHKCSDAECPKYLGIDGMDTGLYNVADLKRPGSIIAICEGEIDTMSVSLSGIPAIGVPGVKGWKPHFSRVLDDFQEVWTPSDGDRAGSGFGKFLAREVRARMFRLPRGKDVNDIFRENGAAGVQRLFTEDN